MVLVNRDPGDECDCTRCLAGEPHDAVVLQLTRPITRQELIAMPRDEFEVVVRRRGSQFDYLDDLPPAA